MQHDFKQLLYIIYLKTDTNGEYYTVIFVITRAAYGLREQWVMGCWFRRYVSLKAGVDGWDQDSGDDAPATQLILTARPEYSPNIDRSVSCPLDSWVSTFYMIIYMNEPMTGIVYISILLGSWLTGAWRYVLKRQVKHDWTTYCFVDDHVCLKSGPRNLFRSQSKFTFSTCILVISSIELLRDLAIILTCFSLKPCWSCREWSLQDIIVAHDLGIQVPMLPVWKRRLGRD